jgi:sodium transport system permease protein
MNWTHVKLIFLREMTDQLRDRRTLFTITILPLLLYPLLGMLLMQIAQINRQQAVRVRIVGLENWPQQMPLFDSDKRLLPRPGMDSLEHLVDFEFVPWPADGSKINLEERARQAIQKDVVDAVLLVEPGFADRLRERWSLRSTSALEGVSEAEGDKSIGNDAQAAVAAVNNPVNGLQFVANMARDPSRIAQERLEMIIEGWRAEWVASQLASAGLNPRLMAPLEVRQMDTAPPAVKRAMLWSKVMPFVMLVWALTGAFYPAIDLCAGEKERGTLETLLSSPARRLEIVWGKLLTVSVFSTCSAVLNLLSMYFTTSIVVARLSSGNTPLTEELGPMPPSALGWLLLLLLPMAAFFSALALAVAALARSTKEGQYYLMPLLLVTLPLVALPMIPSMRLNIGTSLIPVSGAVFLVRSLIESRFSEALIHLPVVSLVTLVSCWLSLRWAIRQFESEAVMFREADRWNLKIWLNHVWRDRGETASPTEALLCGMIILIGMFFAQFMAGDSIGGWVGIVKSTVIVQTCLILMPALLMAMILTRSPRKALRIHRPQMSHLFAAVLIGIALHPSYLMLGQAVRLLYEMSPEAKEIIGQFESMVMAQPIWAVLLLLAVLPAICEELAFRGFIFGGLLRQQGALRAIVVSALLFGFIHSLIQQSIAATMMGLLLGLIAWRTGGVLATMIVHVINNSLTLGLAWSASHQIGLPPALSWMLHDRGGHWEYSLPWTLLSIVISIAMFVVLFRRSNTTEQVVQAEMA